ncbi:capsule biosynthesis protein [Poseidonocella sp. HB161398]|uniref:capsule biosynthesis protein n=1 Tax=Poseidonocella sp. HB161398 TaxID=2320855 RepID=UPI00110A02A1|nr:capsule biosynthesis protein [Poseidonocella sp. HB161398]
MTTGPQADPDPGAARRRARQERRRAKAARRQAAKAEGRAGVEAEGFSGQQLRNAMRLARHHGLAAADPFEAVRQLRAKGIDPQGPANPLNLVVDNTRPAAAALQVPVMPGLSPAQLADEQRQLLEIERIQKDIAQRRKRSFSRLWMRILGLVLLPTLAVCLYLKVVASPVYSTTAEFIVQKASGGSGIGSLLAGTSFGSSQEAVAVQRYIGSKEAMVRLAAEKGFIRHFSDRRLDPMARLPRDATIERAYKLYLRRVKTGYDPTEGVMKLEVMAADPASAVEFADALVSYAEEVVNHLTLRQREDQLAAAERAFAKAEAEMEAAQRRVLTLEETRGVISAEAEIGALMARISAFETQLAQERLELAGLLDNRAPNTARVSASERAIARLETMIAELRAEINDPGAGRLSLAQINGDLRVAEAALATRQAMLQQAQQALQGARSEAERQVGYLSLNVSPVAPEQAAYPRVAANTAMAFLIFAGIYLVVSLTASVLKEQVTN